MEEVLDTYERPYDPDRPVLCLDEQPVQLLKETRRPIPATKRHAHRIDYECERAGTANIFMFTEPLSDFTFRSQYCKYSEQTRATVREKVDRSKRRPDIGANRIDNPFARGCDDSTCPRPTDSVLSKNRSAFATPNYYTHHCSGLLTWVDFCVICR